MIAAVSAGIRLPSAASAASSVGYAWVKGLPDLNRQTRRRIGESGAGWTFTTICSLLHHVGRVGRPQARKAAREDQRLSVGLQAISDESGLSLGKVRRDVAKLAGIGVLAAMRPNVTLNRDPESGRITENRTGRSKATVVILTICQEHLRVKAAPPDRAASHPRMAPTSPPRMAGLAAPNSVHPGRAIQRDIHTKRTPDGRADGVGRPQAAPEAGLPAGEAGGHSAAEASQEGGTSDFLRIVTADPESAGLPPGRLAPQGKATRPQRPQRRPGGDQEGGTTAAEYAEAWHRRDPEEERQRAEYEAAKAAKKAAREAMPEGQTAPPTTTAPPPSLDQEASRNAWRAALAREVG
jgi:hypothetical protein